MCGTENEAAAGQATNGNGTTPAQHQMSATSPYQRIEDYLSNVGRYKIIESMENLPRTEQWGVQPFARRKPPPVLLPRAQSQSQIRSTVTIPIPKPQSRIRSYPHNHNANPGPPSRVVAVGSGFPLPLGFSN